MDGSFFDKAEQLAKSASAVARWVSELRTTIEASDLFVDPFLDPRPPMEQFFADVYYEVTADPAKAFPVFVALLHLYTVVLSETTNWIVEREQRLGSLDRLIRREIDRCAGDEKLHILTFNQDLLIEDALRRLPDKYGEMSLRELYGDVGLVSATVGGGGVTYDLTPRRSAPRIPVHLWKLHGSLNWGSKTRERSPRLGTLFPNGKRVIYMHDSRVALDDMTLSTNAVQGRSEWYFWPAIVPPIYDKQRLMNAEIFSQIWAGARSALEEAERLVLFGYSIPEADVLARQLMRRTFVRNDGLECIEVINPDITMAKKLQDALDPRGIRTYCDAAAYLQHS